MKKVIPLSTIKTFTANDEIRAYLLLREKHLRLTRDGKAYLDVLLTDKTGSVVGKIWDHAGDIEPIIETGAPVGVRAIVESYHGREQLNIKRIVPVNEEEFASLGFSWELILPQTEKNITRLWNIVEKAYDKIDNHHLKQVIKLLIIDNRAKLIQHPASLKLHHAYMGGFLEHICSMLRLGVMAAKEYDLDMDLIIAGVMLHDIGKLKELSGYPNNTYTHEGNFMGHIVLGNEMLTECVNQIDEFPEELLMKLKHIIISHQGSYEYQSPKKPAFPEALLIHYLDEMDARMNMMKTALNKELDDNPWTSLNNYFRIPLYKPQNEKEPDDSQ